MDKFEDVTMAVPGLPLEALSRRSNKQLRALDAFEGGHDDGAQSKPAYSIYADCFSREGRQALALQSHEVLQREEHSWCC